MKTSLEKHLTAPRNAVWSTSTITCQGNMVYTQSTVCLKYDTKHCILARHLEVDHTGWRLAYYYLKISTSSHTPSLYGMFLLTRGYQETQVSKRHSSKALLPSTSTATFLSWQISARWVASHWIKPSTVSCVSYATFCTIDCVAICSTRLRKFGLWGNVVSRPL